MSIIYRYDDLYRLVHSQGEMGGLGLSYATLYATPLVTINRGGYTKHYFEGSNRVCTAVGGGFGGVDWSEVEEQVPAVSGSYGRMHEMQDESVNKTFDGCIGVGASVREVYNLPAILEKQERWRNEAERLHYYHGDHLGSAAYLTDGGGQVVQMLAYLPYGEDWVEQNGLADTTRLGMYRYNGKERDGESGYHYYGARYYWSELWNGWLSVDPMVDKYPGVSPYAYCVWNPVMFVDPDGEEIGWYIDSQGNVIGKDGEDDDKIYLVNNWGDIRKIRNDNFGKGVKKSELSGDVVEVPSYNARQYLKEIYDLGLSNLINSGEYGILIYSNDRNELGGRLYHAQNPIEINENGDIHGLLSWKNSEVIRQMGSSDASNLMIVAHTHNINNNKKHPPTRMGDYVPKGTIGIVFDYFNDNSNTYIYDNNTRRRDLLHMPSLIFFRYFVTPDGKNL